MYKFFVILISGVLILLPVAQLQAESCYALWHKRNLIFAQKGYCFSSSLGKQVFANYSCRTKNIRLTADEKLTVKQNIATEKKLRCNIPTNAGKTVLAIANQKYSFVFEDVSIEGIGRDSQGRWWIQAWTSPNNVGLDPAQSRESEQWFVIFNGSKWTLHGYGTGLGRSDCPSDIIWEAIF